MATKQELDNFRIALDECSEANDRLFLAAQEIDPTVATREQVYQLALQIKFNQVKVWCKCCEKLVKINDDQCPTCGLVI